MPSPPKQVFRPTQALLAAPPARPKGPSPPVGPPPQHVMDDETRRNPPAGQASAAASSKDPPKCPASISEAELPGKVFEQAQQVPPGVLASAQACVRCAAPDPSA
eukprot:3451360-Alexandrium_andersonii.AAC.1